MGIRWRGRCGRIVRRQSSAIYAVFGVGIQTKACASGEVLAQREKTGRAAPEQLGAEHMKEL